MTADDTASPDTCRHPVPLRGRIDAIDLGTGELRPVYDTATEPDGVLLTPCGNRRESVSPPCSQVYKRTAAPPQFPLPVWIKALNSAELPGIHFHDLRHTGNNLSADAGANLRELMDRMGHSSTQAALIYLHATSERQRAVADAVGAFAQMALSETAERARSHECIWLHLARMWHDAARRPHD